MKRIVLNDEELLDSIWQVVLLICFAFFSYIIGEIFSNKIYNEIIFYFFIALLFSIMKLSRIVSIKKDVVKKGIYIGFIGLIYTIESFRVSEIKEVVLKQNNEDYFEIVAIKRDNSEFIIKKQPNKNPALKELELIKTHLNIS